MGTCSRKSQKDNSQKQTGYESEQVVILTCIKSHIQYFDQIDLELLKYPDISLLLRKHIKNYKFIEEGKTWVVVKEIQSFLNDKMSILIRNFNPETDAALQLIELNSQIKKLVSLTQKLLECSVKFSEAKVELFQSFQNQLVQTSIECLIVVNTLISKKLQWWNEEYFKWRQNHLISTFLIKKIDKSNKEIIGSIYDFIQLLIECIKHLGDLEASQGNQETDFKAEQEFLDQFYNQMRAGLIHNSFFSESISNEIIPEQIQVNQNIKNDLLFYHIYKIINFCKNISNMKNIGIDLFVGIVSSCVNTIVGYPMDFIKTRMQLQQSKQGTLKSIINIIKMEGPQAFYRGSILKG